jgi:CheY-like chemotaxis protein
MDGYQLGTALRAGRDVRLVAVTGYGQERDRARSRAAGFEAHLAKPVDMTLLQRLLATP